MKSVRLEHGNYTNQKLNGRAFRLVALILAAFAISPMAQAVVPAPDGGYPGGNTAEGQNALLSRTTGIYNNAVGIYALLSLTTGNYNTANGAGALFSITTTNENTATGAGALFSNSSGPSDSGNTADGAFALFSDTTGHHNTAVGNRALFANTTGAQNVAIGDRALEDATGPGSNTVVGSVAGGSITTGGGNTFIGLNAGNNITTGDNNICIGAAVLGEMGAADSTYIGNINTTAQPIVGGVDGVTVDLTTGKLGHGVSSRCFKEQIKPMDEASELLYSLKPVTFYYKKAIDHTQTLDFGLIAEEVAAVNPELAVRDGQGKICDYRRDAVNAMLLNEFLKEHQTVQELKKEVAALTAGLQKVSAQLEVSKPAPQTVLNNQ